MMDGTGQRYSYDYPISEKEVDFVKSKERIKTIVKWLWLLCIALMFLVEFGIGSLVVWFIAKFIVNKVMDSQIQSHLNESRNARR